MQTSLKDYFTAVENLAGIASASIEKLTERCGYLTSELTRSLSGEIDAMGQERAAFDDCRLQYERKIQNEQDIQAWSVEAHNISYQLKSAIESLAQLRGETVNGILAGVMVPMAEVDYALPVGTRSYMDIALLPGMDTSSIDSPLDPISDKTILATQTEIPEDEEPTPEETTDESTTEPTRDVRAKKKTTRASESST